MSQLSLGYRQQRDFADERRSPEQAAEISVQLSQFTEDPAAVSLLPRAMGQATRWYRPMRCEYEARLYPAKCGCRSEPCVHESLKCDGHGVKFLGELERRRDPTPVHAQLKALRYAELKAFGWMEQGRAARPLGTADQGRGSSR